MRRKDSASSSSRKAAKPLKPQLSKKNGVASWFPSFWMPQSPSNSQKEKIIKKRTEMIEECCQTLKSMNLTTEEWAYVKKRVKDEDKSEKSSKSSKTKTPKKKTKEKPKKKEETGKPKKPKKKEENKEEEPEESESERKPKRHQRPGSQWDAIGGIKVPSLPKNQREDSEKYVLIPPARFYPQDEAQGSRGIPQNDRESNRESKKEPKKVSKNLNKSKKSPIPQKADSPKSEKTDTETEYSIHTSEVLRKERKDQSPATSPMLRSPISPRPLAQSPVPMMPATPPRTPQRSPKAEPIQFESQRFPLNIESPIGVNNQRVAKSKRLEPQRNPVDERNDVEPPVVAKSKPKRTEPPKTPEPAEKRFEIGNLLNPLEPLMDIVQFGKMKKAEAAKPVEPLRANELKKKDRNYVPMNQYEKLDAADSDRLKNSDRLKKPPTPGTLYPVRAPKGAPLPPKRVDLADSKRIEEIRAASPKPRKFPRDERESRIAMGLEVLRKDEYPTMSDAPSDYETKDKSQPEPDNSSGPKPPKKTVNSKKR